MNKRLIEPIILMIASAAVLSVCVLWLKTDWPFLAMLIVVFIGWVNVVLRVAPQVEWNLAGIATAVVCVALTVFLLDRFARWLYVEIRTRKHNYDWPTTWRWKWTLCLFAGVLLMFLAGLVGVGLFRTTSWFVQTPQIVRAD